MKRRSSSAASRSSALWRRRTCTGSASPSAWGWCAASTAGTSTPCSARRIAPFIRPSGRARTGSAGWHKPSRSIGVAGARRLRLEEGQQQQGGDAGGHRDHHEETLPVPDLQHPRQRITRERYSTLFSSVNLKINQPARTAAASAAKNRTIHNLTTQRQHFLCNILNTHHFPTVL